MQAGLSRRVMNIEDIANLVPEVSAKKRGAYKNKNLRTKMKAVRWIGLAKVSALNGEILGDASGAFVNVVAFADSKLSFRRSVKLQLNQMGLQLDRLEDAEPLKERLSKFEVDKEIIAASKRLSSHHNIAEFTSFHTFP